MVACGKDFVRGLPLLGGFVMWFACSKDFVVACGKDFLFACGKDFMIQRYLSDVHL